MSRLDMMLLGFCLVLGLWIAGGLAYGIAFQSPEWVRVMCATLIGGTVAGGVFHWFRNRKG